MAKHILLVDDDQLLRRSLSIQLEQAGYRTSAVASAEEGLELARRDPPDLVLLDVGLPGMDGLEALKEFHRDMDVPIILVTARRRELDTILGLELGADSYITKPFNPDILLANVKAVLRRSVRAAPTAAIATAITVGDIVIDPEAHLATVGGQALDLTAREFALMYALAQDAGKVVPIDELITRVWGQEYTGESQSVYVHIRWLREKIEDDAQHPCRIVNVRGVGYKLVPQPA